MRMWNVNPKMLCRKHLLGEHVEQHMFLGTILHGSSLNGYVVKGLVDTRLIKQRHDQLAEEMKNRGYNHKSPLEYEDKLSLGTVNPQISIQELVRRCPDCAQRIHLISA